MAPFFIDAEFYAKGLVLEGEALEFVLSRAPDMVSLSKEPVEELSKEPVEEAAPEKKRRGGRTKERKADIAEDKVFEAVEAEEEVVEEQE